MEEKELSDGCRHSDNAARKELYDKYASRLLGLCVRYVGNIDTARDVLHDGFLKLYQSFDHFTYRGKGSLLAWLERVMINESLQFIRNNELMNSDKSIEEIDNEYNEPDAEVMDRIPEKELMKFIAELPDGYRTVFNLYVFEDKSHKEIASILHINEKSSSSQFFRAKKILAKKINEWMKDNR